MIAAWPEDLPRPERASWQVQPLDIRRRTQHDAGPPRYRRRLSGVTKQVTLSVILTRDQRAIFDRFWAEDCADGSLYFWMPDPTTDGWPALTSEGLIIDVAADIPMLLSARWLCAWGSEPPVETMHGQIEFRKAFSVMVLP